MLERLNEALLECEAEKVAIETRDDEQAILDEVAKYEAEVRSNYADKKNSELVEKGYEIKAIKNLIAKEEARIASEEVVTEATEEVVAADETADNAFQG